MRKELLPEGWGSPKGYANGICVRGSEWIFLGGQIGWNAQQQFESQAFVPQVKQALENVVAILAEAQAGPEHIVRMTWFVIDKAEYLASLKELGQVYRHVIGKNFPTMSVVQVTALVEDKARVEIEVTAVK